MKTPGRPCRACPWVVENAAGDIPGYDHDKAERLASTSPDADGHGPEFGAPLFACHESNPDQEFVCAGWLATQGIAHPNIRLAVTTGRLDPNRLEPRSGWPALHQTFTDMIAKLRSTR